VPIIWKAAAAGWPTLFTFVDKDYSEDYRIRFIRSHGANQIRCRPIEWYHGKLRHRLGFRLLKRIFDRLVAYSFGPFFLIRNHIDVVANEWSGPFGRERAEYFLRGAGFLRLPVYSLPHGYFLWKNPLFNKEVAKIYGSSGRYPDFSNRNWFTRYVIQSPEHREANVEYGMAASKLVALGSPRFCKEWSTINYRLLCDNDGLSGNDLFNILFFLPHWDYNVHRGECISLLEKISALKGVHLEVKAHTRGNGALNSKEKNQLSVRSNVTFPDEETHSTLLINAADVVVNFGSSVAFEALRQGKPVINPMYLHDNQTFFDHSGAVIDTSDEGSTLSYIANLQFGRGVIPGQLQIDNFLTCRIDGGSLGKDVLQSYLDLLSGREIMSLGESGDELIGAQERTKK
jgi:hypothetical protein